MSHFSFEYASVTESEARMLDDVTSCLRTVGIGNPLFNRARLVISEAFTNALTHGNKLAPEKRITVDIAVNELTLTADITDQGCNSLNDIEKHVSPGLMADHGRGLDLMRHYADDLVFEVNEAGGLRTRIVFDLGENENCENDEKDENKGLPEDKMEITSRETNGVAILHLSGRLDLASGARLKEEIKKHLAKQVLMIHLNLSNVEFINSSGLGSLVSIMKEIRLLKGRFTLSDLANYVQEIFEITQLSHIFEIFPTEDEALASYRSMVTS